MARFAKSSAAPGPVGLAQPGFARSASAEEGQVGLHPLVVAFIIALAIPLFFWLGSLRLSPYRLILVILFIPLSFSWVAGGCGTKRVADYFVILYSLWLGVSIFANHGLVTLEFVGISIIEIMTPYLLARRYVRSSRHVIGLARLLFWMTIILLPAAIIESTTGIRIYNEIFAKIGNTFNWADYPPRMGLYRAQVNFEHPILFGVFVATTFSIVWEIPRPSDGRPRGLMTAWAPAVATFFSLSVGAYIALVVQIGLRLWGWVLKGAENRWKILAGLSVAGYIFIDVGSNRTPFEVFISYLTFDQHSAYWRVHIFNFGMENVMANPVFGLGLRDWARPWWMWDSTVDNFWLLQAMRYGILGFVFSAAAYFATLTTLIRAKLHDEVDIRMRRALAFTMIGLGISICTVHLWNSTFVYFMFLLGCCFWPAEAAARPAPAEGEAEALAEAADEPASRYARRDRPRYTRFES